MGKYFGRESRYPREEIERQAQEAIDARVSLGRPPPAEWLPLEARLAEIDRVMAARPPVVPLPEPQPMRIRAVRVPRAADKPPAQAAKPAGARKSRQPVAATPSTN